MTNWKQVEARCAQPGVAALGFAVGRDRHGPVLLRHEKKQAYTPGGAMDVIEWDLRAEAA